MLKSIELTDAGITAAPITAVIPLYNYDKYIASTIESLLNQTVRFERIIVVNDGSTDSSLAVAHRYADKVTVLDYANQGQTAASFSVLDLIESKYVHFVDADDLLCPKMNEVLWSHYKKRYAKIQFMLQGIDRLGQATNSLFPQFPAGYDAAAMREDNVNAGFYICPPTTGNIYSLEFLKSLNVQLLDPRDSTDGVPAMIAPYFGDVLTVNQPLGYYRVHGDNRSSWDRPTQALLQAEIDMFSRRWLEAAALIPNLPPPASDCQFLAERKLFSRALSERVSAQQVLSYIHSISRTKTRGGRRLAMAGAAGLLAVLPSKGRRKVIYALRSPINRNRAINALIVATRRARLMHAMRPRPI